MLARTQLEEIPDVGGGWLYGGRVSRVLSMRNVGRLGLMRDPREIETLLNVSAMTLYGRVRTPGTLAATAWDLYDALRALADENDHHVEELRIRMEDIKRLLAENEQLKLRVASHHALG